MTSEEIRELTASLPERVRRILSPGAEVVVTGCAGFIGSSLTETLLAMGCRVVGVDCLTDYYDVALKRENMAGFLAHPDFEFLQEDLLRIDCAELLAGKRVCFHLAAQAGVRASWGDYFAEYLHRNVLATQRLLEACLSDAVRGSLARFVYSSSSSVYGDQDVLPVTEAALPQPRSPYGVTKLAAEHLCVLYSLDCRVPTTSLRYFTVYGPRQRPDMAFRKFIDAAFAGRPFAVFGDGAQTRDFTYISDAVQSNLLGVACEQDWAVFNTGGGHRVVFKDALDRLRDLLAEKVPGLTIEVEYQEEARGDVRDTFADRTHVEGALGYRPTVSFDEGLARQVDWAVARRNRRD